MTNEQIASLAQSLRDNEAFQMALDSVRDTARDGLGRVDPDDKNQIIELQATVKLVDDLRENLDTFIRAGATRKPPGLA